MLKVTLLMILKKHMKLANEQNFKGTSEFFMPVKYIIHRMRINMMVQEQINKLLYGMSYQKKDDFTKNKAFTKIVKGFQDYYDPHLFGDDKDQGTYAEKYNEFCSYPSERKRFLWDNKLRNFLLKSDEKWILDQYNLIKLFLFQNSWDVQNSDPDSGDFSHPIYRHYQNIKPRSNKHLNESSWSLRSSERKDNRNVRNQASNKSVFDKEIQDDADDKSVLSECAKISIQSSKKCDILALAQTIEELENKLKMFYILIDEDSINGENESYNDPYDQYESFMKQQLAMINFGKNFEAIKKHQDAE